MRRLSQIGYTLARLFQRPATSWAVIGLGILAYWIVASKPIQSRLLLPGLSLVETAVFIVGGLAYISWLVPRTIESLVNRFSNAIAYREVKYFWSLESDGTVSGVIIYKVQNRTRKPQSTLPADGLIWFRRPKEEEITFRIVFRDGDKPHAIRSGGYQISSSEEPKVRLKFPSEHEINWEPSIFPPLEPGETVTYEVEISTPKTELDAFTHGGSHIGFPVRRSTGRVEFLARAPKGWRFEMIPPQWVVQALDGGESGPLPVNPDKPSTEGDGSILRWDVDSPAVGFRYVVNYRLTAKQRSVDAVSTEGKSV